jgi:hypothetical protein
MPHIPIHRLWTFVKLDHQLEGSAKDHLLNCPSCFEAMKACFRAQTFMEVIEKLGRDDVLIVD